MSTDESQNETQAFQYGDPKIASYDAPVPGWLNASYWLWIIVGLLCALFYWNGSWGFLDPGHWGPLQEAANTTFPLQNVNSP